MIIGAEQRESNTATTETDQAQKKKKSVGSFAAQFSVDKLAHLGTDLRGERIYQSRRPVEARISGNLYGS